MKKYTLLLLFFAFNINALYAKVILPAIISNNMVLQQQASVALWGTTDQSHLTVRVSWDNQRYTADVDKQGVWKLYVNTPSAGGPYDIAFDDGEKLIVKNVLIGEVWICSGQSNMEIPVQGMKHQPVLNASQLYKEASNSKIRLFHIERTASATAATDCKGTWMESDSAAIADFSAIGYQYAKLLQQKLKVPVGIMQSAWGGTIIKAWMDVNTLKTVPANQIPDTTNLKVDKNYPGALFNGMIAPIINYNFKGVIWYQGESNGKNYAYYAQLMAALVKNWRTSSGRGDWPFNYVQIAPYGYNDWPVSYKDGIPRIREAQQKALSLIPNSGMVVSLDVGSEETIHPPDKTTISRRLAALALARTYHQKNESFQGPVFKSMQINGANVKVSFNYADKGLIAAHNKLQEFELAGNDHQFHPCKALIKGNAVWLRSKEVPKPVAVRYSFKAWVTADLYNKEGLPAAPFRTDNW